MKATIAATLIDANQNSNSPNALTDTRLVAVSAIISTSEAAQIGTPGSHPWMIAAPAAASTARTMTQKDQYSQPTRKRAQPPTARPAYSAKDPVLGWATAISPSIRMTSTTSSPAAR